MRERFDESGSNSRHHGFWSRVPMVLLMAMVLVVAGLLSAMTAMRFAIRGREVVVPEVVDMTRDEAAARLFDRGLGLDVTSRRFHDTVPAGRVVDQSPPPGVSVKSARSVRVLISLGERRFPVPEIEGVSVRGARMLLGQHGRVLGHTLYAHTDRGEPSMVVHQVPPAGDVGSTDPRVSVLVSMGNLADYFIMPDVVGQDAASVASRMRSEGFRVGDVARVPRTDAASGRIVGQSPAAGYKVSKSDIVRLEVSE